MPYKYDRGPTLYWETIFNRAPLDFYKQYTRFRTEFCPVYYRGRLDGTARVLIIGQDPSTDEILAQRILVGAAGQLVQGLLRKLGIDHSYGMFNTFLYGIRGQFDATVRKLSAENPILSYRNEILDRFMSKNRVEAVIAFGNGAQDAIARWPGSHGLTIFGLVHPAARAGVTEDWNNNLPQLLAAIQPDPGINPAPVPYGIDITMEDYVDIPRFDLPFGIPDWHGTGGTHSTRGGSKTKIIWNVEKPD